MRTLGFLVADKNMEACLQGLFSRAGWHRSIGCAPVDVAEQDVHVAAGHADPGLYAHGGELLRPFRDKYAHMVVMVDAEWQGSPGPRAIATRLEAHLQSAGWAATHGLALVLDPEVDTWLWARGDHTARAMGWESWNQLHAALTVQKLWPADALKPPRPKEAAEWALRQRRKARSSLVYRRIAESVGLGHCVEPGFASFRKTLKIWFPAEGA